MRANLRYGKNQKREDVKSHHYIISFLTHGTRTDNSLTVDRAQALGEEFCAEHFPGHQAIVCTHPDGHNHSGNIHVHIVINSLRIEEVPLLPYMDRPADTRAGCKHRCTDAAMEYFKAEVMEMCHRENLYQIDLLHGSKNRITEREYWAHKKDKPNLTRKNAALAAEGKPVKQTKFETDKAKLRQTIRNAMSEATTFDEFSALLLQQGVTVKESRGRLSYLISSKNANYGDAEKYLTFAHDEFTMKPTLDANGRLVPREDYRISTLNCGEENFAVACMRSNLRYGKNQKREDVKSHHYIISFDPRDGPDNGLTVDKAQELGERFCREQFPGHQAIVCTHPDGHNQSGNIHVHIVINSLRIENVPLLPYMDRPADTKAGCKHRCTDAAMEYFKSEVMELCHEAGLYQIDLLNGSANRVTEREYWARKKGQAALDQENAALAAEGKPTKPTRFETDKEKLRQIIRKTLNESFTVEDFTQKLLQYGVTVKESRGRFSYFTPDRTKPITARKLGDSFDKAAVLAALEQNALRFEHTLTSNDAIPLDRTLSSNEGASGRTAPKQSAPQAPLHWAHG